MGVRCLIVDDNPGFLQIARESLESGGIVVVGVASTSAEAISRTLEADPDVALVDVVLGAESGFDLARRLVAQGGSRRTQVIMTSTRAEEDFSDVIAASPAIAFLPKWELSAAAVEGLLRRAAQRNAG
jgi:CheY-like chemotaxis protein